MNKKKKKKIIIITTIVLLVLAIITTTVIIIYNKKQEEKLLKDIKNHYSELITISKDSKIYDKNQKVIGSVKKGLTFNLEKQKIKDTTKQYFNIKDTEYYIYYKNIENASEKEETSINGNYITFNQNIKTKEKTEFYKDGNIALTLNESINLPIEYMDDTYYYVKYLDYLFQIKKETDDELIESVNTDIKESEYISILHYETIYNDETCNKTTCTKINKFEEHINYLKEQGYYTITLDDYINYLDKKIRLKEKAILITTSNSNNTLTSWNDNNEYKVNLIDSNTPIKFTNTNKKTTKDSDKNNLDRYNIKTTTTLDDFKKMVAGETVVEKVISVSNEQRIPVLNYHFFYDPTIGEECNESICLEVSKFKEQLNYLRDNGYKTLTMEEFTKWMYNEIELPEKSVLITVDDGAMGTGLHNGNKLIPILEEYNMHATLFLISGWWSVENYRSKNLDIQSHTYDMHQYGECGKGQVVCSSKEQLLQDLQKSLTIVDNNNSFCFPFYSYSASALETVKEAGFKLAFIGGNRKAKRSDNKYLVPRYPIYKTTTIQQFINMVN